MFRRLLRQLKESLLPLDTDSFLEIAFIVCTYIKMYATIKVSVIAPIVTVGQLISIGLLNIRKKLYITIMFLSLPQTILCFWWLVEWWNK